MLRKPNFIYFALAILFAFASLLCPSYALDISGKSAVLIEADSGEVIYEKNADIRLPMASTTKIMTGIIAIENCPLDEVVKIPKEAVGIEGSSIYLIEGEELTVRELLYALLLESANDASVALAIKTSGDVSEFADLMNRKADELCLENTHFTNPHGLDDDEHYTSASDLSKITAYAMKNPVFKEIVSTYKKTIPLNNGEGTRVLINHNKLLRSYNGSNGVKTGYTKHSGRCFVSSAQRDGVNLICVTLNAPNDWHDHSALLDYGFEKYESVDLAEAGDYLLELNVIDGKKSTVLVSNTEPLSVTLKKDNINISAKAEYNRLLSAPISKGDTIGRIVFYNNDEKIGAIDLVALENINEINYKNFFERLFTNGKD
ncbi:MAG: D-alanyl-D-alanine carboxypeptidase [Clostridia bacterium]|nr:D-alanyl-D-alanine carboxypeptidase [Clostridia bacterium]